MKKWICEVCGYVHNGEEAPDRCPQCGAPKHRFHLEGKKKSMWNMLSILSIIVLLAALCYVLFSCNSSVTVDNSTVSQVDLKRYLGKWYEVARFDHSFERDQTRCTATYTLEDDGKIMVVNRGWKDGEWNTSEGKAKLTENPGLLRVSFFGPFYSDYRIMMLAPDYSYSLVGGNGDNYLWILSRTPQLNPETRSDILREAQRRGYKTENLIWVDQEGT